MNESEEWGDQFDKVQGHVLSGINDDMYLSAAVMALLDLAARLAIDGGVEPPEFAAMVKDAVMANLSSEGVTLQ